MRLFFGITMLLAATGAAAADPSVPIGDMPVFNPSGGGPKACPPISRFEAMEPVGKLAPQTLEQLPAADLYKAVYRRIGGCVVPMIVGYGFGGRTRTER
jgi:hypothetical protein